MINCKQILLLTCIFVFSSSVMYAQKAKFKGADVKVQKIRLPTNFIAPENRTYDLFSKGKYASEIETHERGIYGWNIDGDNPTVKAVISIYGFSIGSAKKNSQKKTKKDDEGKVIESWTMYNYSGGATGRGTMYIYGEENPFIYNTKKEKEKKKGKGKTKAEEKKEKADADLASNPFLAEEDIVEAEENDLGEDIGLEGEELPLIKTIKLDQNKQVRSNASRSASTSYKEYLEKHRPKLQAFRDQFPSKAYYSAISSLNREYGYAPVKNIVYLKAMKSDKHPEFKNWNAATTAIETLFKAFKYNKSIAANQSKFDPILEYFEGVMNKIPESDKKGKKLKAAAFQNLTNTMYNLDRHQEIIDLSNKYLESKTLGKHAKRILEKAEKLKAHLAFHQMEARHLESIDDVDDSIVEDEVEEDIRYEDN